MELNLHSFGPEHFEAGQTLSGAIIVNTPDPWQASDVTIALIGYTKVEWSPDTVYPSVPISAPLIFYEKKTCLEMVHKVSDHGKFSFIYLLRTNNRGYSKISKKTTKTCPLGGENLTLHVYLALEKLELPFPENYQNPLGLEFAHL